MNKLTFIVIAFLILFVSCEFPIEGEIGNEAPADFKLEYPSNENDLVRSYEVHLQWAGSYDNDGTIANYIVYLGESTNLSAIDTTDTTTRKYTIDSLKSETTYYWQIEAVDDVGGTTKSEVWSFTTDNPLGVPNPISPADGAVNVDIPVTFEFEMKNARIDGYEIYVSKVGSIEDIMVAKTTSELEAETEYTWFVIGVDNSEDRSSAERYWRGNMASFTTK